MIVLNFGHPLTQEHKDRVQEMTGNTVAKVIEVHTHFDHNRPFAVQAAELVDGLGFSSTQWQTEALLVVPPALHVIAVTMLAELHGRMGYFPAVLRLRPAQGSNPPRYEVAEIINLQAVRDAARTRR